MSRVVLGLHITKCAGTSLALAVRRELPAESWYVCSEFVDNQKQCVMELSERIYLGRLRFIFGHYIHQSMIAMLCDRPVVLITGMREPIERAVSEFYHMCRVNVTRGAPPLTAEQFLEIRRNTTCEEVLRAFPAARTSYGSLAERAAKVLDLFDLIYESRYLEESVKPILELLGVENSLPRVNERSIEGGYDEFIEREAVKLRDAAPNYFAEDMELYKYVAPRMGELRSGAAMIPWRERWVNRPAGAPPWLAPVMEDLDPISSLQEHQFHFLVRDFIAAGRDDELRTLIERKGRTANLLAGQFAMAKSGNTDPAIDQVHSS